MTRILHPGILIKIDADHSRLIREWVHEIDWQIIVNLIELRGAALGFEKNPDTGTFSFCTIKEIPKERGRFRPHYGDFGGGFEFCFRSHPDGVQLIALSAVVEILRKNLKQLDLVLPGIIETQVPADRYDIMSPDDSQFVNGENSFGFHNNFFDIFQNWEWYSEDIKPFEFRFYPGSVGCMIEIEHLESSALLDLTKDVNW